MRKFIIILIVGLWCLWVPRGLAQGLDYGDAPEGVVAYPSSGLVGNFPTCMTVGPSLWIQHGLGWAYFGPAPMMPLPHPPGVGWDPDADGNGGFCPIFNPNNYDMDECFMDLDAGLMFPAPYTIQGPPGSEVVIPCPGGTGSSMGGTCQTMIWGINLDIWITNTRPNIAYYVNVLMDWDQNGVWHGAASCPSGPSPEHVLVDWPIPPGYFGPLSGLGPPPFQSGPHGGYVWARFSITERTVGQGWDGAGVFEDGETEDYLLRLDELDYGDAPDPSYPTLAANNGASHAIMPGFFLGAGVDGDVNGQPDATATGDDVIDGNDDEDGVTFQNLTAGNPNAIMQVTVSTPGGGAFIDAWIDFNANGSWADAGEQIFASQPVVNGVNNLNFSVPPTATVGSTFARVRLSLQGGLSYTGFAPDGEVEDYFLDILIPVELSSFNAASMNGAVELTWTTQSETENLGFHLYRNESENGSYRQITRALIPGAGSSQTVHHYHYTDVDVEKGKTYYYKLADISFTGVVRWHGPISVTITPVEDYVLEQNYPNPFNPETVIPFNLRQAGEVTLSVYNLQGQKVCDLVSGKLPAGRHTVKWNGRDGHGVLMPSGIYVYTLKVNDFVTSKKMHFLR